MKVMQKTLLLVVMVAAIGIASCSTSPSPDASMEVIREQKEQLEQTVVQLQGQIAMLIKQLEQTPTSKSELEAKNKALKEDKAFLQAKLAELDAVNKGLARSNATLKAHSEATPTPTPLPKISESEAIARLGKYFSDQELKHSELMQDVFDRMREKNCASPVTKTSDGNSTCEILWEAFIDFFETTERYMDYSQNYTSVTASYEGPGAWKISFLVQPRDGPVHLEQWWVFESGEVPPTTQP